MPYIPPPPRPPAPPRIPTPAPPRIPNFQNQQRIHFQNQQRIQQQQFHHQQQQRAIQQHHQQQQRFHQNIIMENQRRHQQQQQLHQQQLQRQRQALEFQRQQDRLRQDQFRRQQDQLRQDQLRRQQEQQRQEQLRRQQQDQLRNQQRQQEFWRNYQKSTGLNGATVVNIAPGIQVETQESTIPLEEFIQIQVNLGQQDPEVHTAQGAPPPAMSEATVVTTPPTANGVPQPSPTPSAPPAATPQFTPTVPNGVAPTPSVSPRAPPADIIPPKPKEPPNNTIALKDGSIIVLKAEDEILFRGPKGVEMIVNCLPLYEPLPMTEEKEENGVDTKNSPVKVAVKESTPPKKSEDSDVPTSPTKPISLIKARSVNALDTVAAELELHDHDVEMNKSQENVVGSVVALPPRSWSKSYAKNFTVMVHNKSSPSALWQSKSQEDLAGSGESNSGKTGMTRSATLDAIKTMGEEDVESSPSSMKADESSTAKDRDRSPVENSAGNSDNIASQSGSSGVTQASSEKPKVESSVVETPQSEDTTAGETTEESPPAEAAATIDSTKAESGPMGEEKQEDNKLADDLKNEESPKQETKDKNNAEVPKQETKEQNEELSNSSPEVNIKDEAEQRDEGLVEAGSGSTDDHSGLSSPDQQIAAESDNAGGNDQQKSHEPLQLTKSEVSPKREKKRKLRASRSMSPTNEDENYSDEDTIGQELKVNYLDRNTMSTLKRSSGSVSFFSRAQTTSPVVVLGAENNMIMDATAAKSAEDPGPITKPPLMQEAVTIASQTNSSPTAPSQEVPPGSLDSPPQTQAQPQPPPLLQYSVSEVLIPSPLPDPPATIDPSYVERSGWLNKLSHRKGMFGDKWQKRYFVLHRSWLYYFKKYGDSNPRGVIRLLPNGWCRPVSQGAKRMGDAVVKSDNNKIISVLRCIAVHRPSNFVASLCDLLDTDGVAETFRSTTLSVTNTQHFSRTYYMVAPSDSERESWVKSISTNIKAYSHSSEALTNACKELKIMLRAVHSTLEPKHIPALLYLIHSKRNSLFPAAQQDGASSS